MARNEQLIRQHKILQILERRRFGATLNDIRDSLVEEIGLTSLHERSVRRDIEALQAAGFDIGTEDTQSGKVWKLRRTDKGIHKLNVSATELIALSMGREFMLPLMGSQFWHGIETFWNKVREQLPSGVWEMYEKFRENVYVAGITSKSYEKQHGILKTLNRSVEEHRVVEVEYETPGKPVATRRLMPYGIAVYKASIYLLAIESKSIEARDSEDENVGKLIRWKLDRFEKATALDEWFKPDPDVSIREHMQQTIGIFTGKNAVTYTIRLTRRAALWVREEPWHPSQVLTEQEDGFFVLTVPAYQALEVIPKVLELGFDAEILAPEQGRNEMRDIVAKLHAIYSPAKK